MAENRARIRVVNPNSNEAVTSGIDAALEPLRFADGPEIVCSTLSEGPLGIETQADVESVTLPLRRLVEADNRSDAFVIACYSDPGLHLCREGTSRPVFGIAECGVLTALACRALRGHRDPSALAPPPPALSAADGLARPLRRRAAAGNVGCGERRGRRHLGAADRGRPRTPRPRRRRRGRPRLCRHGAPPPRARSCARSSGHRSDPG